MARDTYVDIVGYIDTSGNYKPLSNIEVNVYLAGTTTPATIYVARTGGTTRPNPFTTGADGSVEFWIEAGDYDILFHDLNVPVRIGNKTIGFNSLNGAAGGIPSNRVAGDAGLTYSALDAVSQRQIVPLGSVIAWWRPTNTIAIPTGWAIGDGSTITSTNHDFGTGGSIVLPDLRNKFILGASSSLADDAAATTGDAVGNAPGIRGAGGSHAHTHTIVNDGPGTSSNGTHTHTGSTSGAIDNSAVLGSLHSIGGFQDAHYHNLLIDGGAGAHSHTVNAHAHGGATGTQNNSRPLYVGLLYIIKIKRN